MCEKEYYGIMPCCKEKLPAPLYEVDMVTCTKCNVEHTGDSIREYNEMIKGAEVSEGMDNQN